MSLRLIREIHEILLSRGRGGNQEPGEFRRSQNWIGGTRPGNAAFVPPPPELVIECMGRLETFLHGEANDMPLLIRAALAHVQLSEPILDLSLYFKANRQTYYELLNSIRTSGNWEAWVEFFLTGVKETSEQATASARRLITLLDADRKQIQTLGRPAASVLRVFHFAQTHPILSIAPTAEKTGSSFPTVAAAVEHLQRLGILQEITGRQRTGYSPTALTWIF